MDNSSGVGVVDKVVAVLDALSEGPATLAALVERSGLARPTAHRLATALEHHGLVTRDGSGSFVLGPRVGQLTANGHADRLVGAAQPVLRRLCDVTGESAQLYRRQRSQRVCVAVAERTSGLRDTVPLGEQLPMAAGSGAQVLLAWEHGPEAQELAAAARFPAATLAAVRRRGWAASVGEREAGVASVSAPVRAVDSSVVAAVSVSGPIERLTRNPGRVHAAAVMDAAAELSLALGWSAALG